MIPSIALSRSLKPCLVRARPLHQPTHRTFVSSEAPKSGASIFQRITSFLVGAGLMALGTQFYLYQELKEGNKLMLQKQKELEKRLQALEK